jgi:myo-inositol 2-dehydrogenase / D-chiro-inositol 1-dehydrogenase
VTTCRIGFVGAGGVATRHARVLSGFDDVNVVAVTEPVPERGDRFASAFGARSVRDLDELLSQELDAVYVCVPPLAHGPVEEAVLAAGLAMFVEKPLAVDVTTAERIAMAVADAGVVTAVGHHWRYAATVERAREHLEDRTVHLLVGSWLDKVPPVPWWVDRAQSGGQVVEQAVHVLDLARLLVGEVTEVHALTAGVPDTPGASVDAATGAVLRFDSGAVGTLAATCLLRGKHRAALELYADGLALEIGENELRVSTGAGEPQRWSVDPDEAKRAVDRAFVDAVHNSGADAVRASYEEALRTHRVACALARSARSGRPESVRQEQ